MYSMRLGKTVFVRETKEKAQVGIIIKVHDNFEVDICILPDNDVKTCVKFGDSIGSWSDTVTTPRDEQGRPDYSVWDEAHKRS